MPKRFLAAAVAAATALALSAVAAPPSTAVAAVTSSISFTSGTTAQIGVYNWLGVAIGTSDGTTRPTGGVQFFNTDGQLVGSASTSASGTAGATASIPWVPTQERTYSFTATFISDNPAVSGSSTSLPITIQATPNGQVVSIAAQQMYLGIPTTLVATVYPSTLEGSVAFSVNELRYGTGPSVPVVNGSASQTFTPTGLGWQQFIVSFTATNSPGVQGAASQWVNVLRPLGTDDISLSPTPTTLANGQSVDIVATTVAGAPAVLTAAGGCTLVGSTLTATTGSGTCTVTGTSPSTGGYLGVTESWPVTLTPGKQTATISAPASGKVKAGSTVTLSTSSQRTNADQRISWRITKGKNTVCTLKTKAGKTRLTLKDRGRCTVRGTAPAVTGEWNAYRVTRAYRAN